MKKRSMILALASMLGISTAATAVSGFAWFTTQITASITGGTYKVGSASGDLQIAVDSTAAHYNCTPALKEGDDTTLEVKPANKSFADSSSVNGKDFYKLKNIINTETAHSADFVVEDNKKTENSVSTWMSKVNTSQMVAVTWTMTVKNTEDVPTMDVYLTNNGALFTDALSESQHTENATGDAAKSYVDAYRLAIFNVTEGDDADSPLVFFYSNYEKGLTISDKNDNNTYKYDTTNKWDGSGAVPTNHASKSTVKSISNLADVAAASDAKSVSNAKSQLLVSGLTKTAAKLKFVVWCEGTDTPEKTIDNNNKVSLSMGLIGLNTAA